MAARQKITNEKIIQINELYAKLKVKSHVARELGVSPATVTKYLIANYIPIAERKIVPFQGEVPKVNPNLFKVRNWALLLELSEKEKSSLEELRKEITL